LKHTQRFLDLEFGCKPVTALGPADQTSGIAWRFGDAFFILVPVHVHVPLLLKAGKRQRAMAQV
jgi:hypothetical protein